MLHPTASVLTSTVHSEMVKTVRFMLLTTPPIPFITPSFPVPCALCSHFTPGATRTRGPRPAAPLPRSAFPMPARVHRAARAFALEMSPLPGPRSQTPMSPHSCGPHRALLFEPSPQPDLCARRPGRYLPSSRAPPQPDTAPSTACGAQELPGSTPRTGLRHALAMEGANSDRGVSARRCGVDTKLTMSYRRAQAPARQALGAASQRALWLRSTVLEGNATGAAWRGDARPTQTGQRTVKKCASGASAAPTPERKEKGRGTESRRARGRGSAQPRRERPAPSGPDAGPRRVLLDPAHRTACSPGPAAWPLRPDPPGLA